MNYSQFVNEQKLSAASRHDRYFMKRLNDVDVQYNRIAMLFTGAIGAASESGELLEVIAPPYDKDNIVDELGDVLFYVTVTGGALGVEEVSYHDPEYIEFSELYSGYLIKDAVILLTISTSKYLDIIKKILFQGKDITLELLEKLSASYKHIYKLILLCSDIIDVPLEYIKEGNMNKLNARYKNNFSVSESENKTK